MTMTSPGSGWEGLKIACSRIIARPPTREAQRTTVMTFGRLQIYSGDGNADGWLNGFVRIEETGSIGRVGSGQLVGPRVSRYGPMWENLRPRGRRWCDASNFNASIHGG